MEVITWESASGIIICMPKLEGHEPYILCNVSTAVTAQADEHKAAWADGQITYNSALDGMTVKISGDIVARGNKNMGSGLLYEKLCSTLCAAFNPKTIGTLYYNTAAGQKYVKARPISSVSITDEGRYNGTFDIDLQCDSPYWIKSKEESMEIGNIVGGFSFPFSFPVQFGWYTQKREIHNYSGFVIEPVIEFMQVTTKVIITNETTCEVMQIDHEVKEGERLIIDSQKRTITLHNNDGETDVSNWITLDSDFITLTHGVNIIKISKERAKTPPNAIMRWHIPLLAR